MADFIKDWRTSRYNSRRSFRQNAPRRKIRDCDILSFDAFLVENFNLLMPVMLGLNKSYCIWLNFYRGIISAESSNLFSIKLIFVKIISIKITLFPLLTQTKNCWMNTKHLGTINDIWYHIPYAPISRLSLF